jgi:hypothetical protein
MTTENLKPTAIPAIDVHAHYGQYVYQHRDGKDDMNLWMTGDAATVARRARLAGIEWTVVSPLLALFPRGNANTAAGNEEAAAAVPRTRGLLQWVVVHPCQPETYAQAERLLREPWCVGIKLHPEEHAYPIKDHGKALFAFAARHRAVVLTHSGDGNSDPREFVPLADEFPEVRVILAHIGHNCDGDPKRQVRAIQASRHGNVYADTSSICSMFSGIIEWAVREAGADHILFGTDTPLYFAAAQRMRIEQAEISDGDREKILSGNARKLLRIPPAEDAVRTPAGTQKRAGA